MSDDRAAPPGPEAPTPAPGPMPLARLFAMAFRQLIEELHARLAARGWTMRTPYGFVLVAASQGPLTGASVAELMGMTKQAASKLVDAMEAEGYVRREAAERDRRAKVVVLTDRGRRLLGDVEAIYAELEAEWAGIVGRPRVEAMRGDLLTVMRATHGGRLPPIRPAW